MMIRRVSSFTGLLVATTTLIAAGPASALTMQDCSAKYKAARAAGTAKSIKWNDFRKAECGADATAAPAAAAKPETKSEPAPAPSTKAATKSAPAPAPAPSTPRNAVFPNGVAPMGTNESAGKARMQICDFQYT